MYYSLKEGLLLKLVEEMKSSNNNNNNDRDSNNNMKNGDGCEISKAVAVAVVLQIRSIIPVLEEGDLWPNRGFFLKVSDASHALYVSLSKQQNDMILSNKLHLGQFIHVTGLQDAAPLPLLLGVSPIPGRRPCHGTPQDIISPPQPQPRPDKYKSGTSGTGRARSSSPSKPRPKRRSWSESEILGVKQIFDSSSVVKQEIIKLPWRSASANVSPVRTRYDSSDDSSSTVSRSRVGVSGKRFSKSSTTATKSNNLHSSSLHSLCNVVCDRKGAETRISWTSLPSNLVNHAKEVIRQRDIAMQAAADALQQACASERLLNSLSTMSQFPLAEGDDLQPFVDKFFTLQHDLAQTSLILQSLTYSRRQDSESCTSTSVQDAMSIALERKKNANAWIKSAIALDLSPCLSPLTTPPDPTKTSPSSGRCTRPKGRGCIHIRKNSNDTSVEIPPLVLAFDKEDDEDDEAELSRGNIGAVCAAAEMARTLEEECKKVLLIHVDKYLDEVDRKSSLAECDDHRVAGMMYKVKMVSDWLNSSVKKEGKDEAEAYARVRDKIYDILLKHVERTAAVAFDRCK